MSLSRKPMKRSGPIARKKPMVKKPKPSTLKNKCDKLAQKRCVSLGYCEACGWTGPKVPPCSLQAPLQWCHLKSRRFAVLRHDPKNSVCMCAAHHRYFTDHPDEFTRFIDKLDPTRWDYLNERLQMDLKPNYELVLIGLKELAESA